MAGALTPPAGAAGPGPPAGAGEDAAGAEQPAASNISTANTHESPAAAAGQRLAPTGRAALRTTARSVD